MPGGRPTDYSPEIAATIRDRLAEGQSLRQICESEDMPGKTTVLRWLGENEEFRTQYAIGREAQTEYWAEEIIEISDNGSNDTYTDPQGGERTNQDVIARSRLRVDTRKWLMARMAPKKYGDRVTQEVTGPGGGPVQTEDLTNLSQTERARRIGFALELGVQAQGKQK